MLDTMPVRQRLLFIFLTLMIPVGVLLYTLIVQMNQDIAFESGYCLFRETDKRHCL